VEAIEPRAGDPRFFPQAGPFGVAALAAAIGAEASFDDGRLISGVAPVQRAGAHQLSFIDNRRYAPLLAETRAGVVVVHPDLAARVPEGCVALVTKDPYRGWALAAAMLHPAPPAKPGIDPRAAIDPVAQIDPSAEIGPFAVIGARARIGAHCRIGPHAVIGEGVSIGAYGRVGAHASVSHAVLGDRVYIYPGARIGQDGFGFVSSSLPFLTVPQLGRVILEDDVEVGANSTIDRGSAQDTVIGAGSRIDNLVQIGHNVRLGRNCVLAAQVGVSGSTVLEDFVMLGGQAGLAGHLHIGKGAKIAAQSGLMADVPARAEMMGSPAEPIKEYLRGVAVLRRFVRGYKASKQESQTPETKG
jgi:UDP-3-O-[3-hydroxymyristoyl] glucosamine N-acyltransferase